MDPLEETFHPVIVLSDERLVYRYSGITIDRLLELDIYNFRILLVNAIIEELNKSEEGKAMLQEYALISKHNSELDKEGLKSIL